MFRQLSTHHFRQKIEQFSKVLFPLSPGSCPSSLSSPPWRRPPTLAPRCPTRHSTSRITCSTRPSQGLDSGKQENSNSSSKRWRAIHEGNERSPLVSGEYASSLLSTSAFVLGVIRAADALLGEVNPADLDAVFGAEEEEEERMERRSVRYLAPFLFHSIYLCVLIVSPTIIPGLYFNGQNRSFSQ